MKEEIDWKKELLESGRFNDKFQKNLLEDGAKNFLQGIFLGYMYSRWRKIRGLDKDNSVENKGQLKSSFKEFEKETKTNILNVLDTALKTPRILFLIFQLIYNKRDIMGEI